VSTPGLVSSLKLVQTVSNGVTRTLNQDVPSVFSPPVFKRDPLLKEWEFLINTKGYAKKATYYFRVMLSDATFIDFLVKNVPEVPEWRHFLVPSRNKSRYWKRTFAEISAWFQ